MEVQVQSEDKAPEWMSPLAKYVWLSLDTPDNFNWDEDSYGPVLVMKVYNTSLGRSKRVVIDYFSIIPFLPHKYFCRVTSDENKTVYISMRESKAVYNKIKKIKKERENHTERVTSDFLQIWLAKAGEK